MNLFCSANCSAMNLFCSSNCSAINLSTSSCSGPAVSWASVDSLSASVGGPGFENIQVLVTVMIIDGGDYSVGDF